MNSKKNFWQIHGEIKKPSTIMLGLDHYCGSIGKIDSYIKGGYKYNVDGETVTEKSIEVKLKENSFNNSSWVELFFNSNIHIIGFTFDYSEIDLWWIINKRARLMKSDNLKGLIKNKVSFHCETMDEQKKGLLESMGVSVEIIPLTKSVNPYFDFYKALIRKLKTL